MVRGLLVWYDVQYDFDSGVRHEQPGLYMGSDVDVKLSQIKTLPKMEIDPVQGWLSALPSSPSLNTG